MSRPPKPERYEQEPNGYWYVFFFRDGKSQRESLGTKDPDEARRRFAFWLTASAADPNADPEVNHLLKCYEEEHLSKKPSYDMIIYRLKYLRLDLGDLRVSQLTADKIKSYGRDRDIVDGTRRTELQTLIAALNYAVLKERLTVFPHITLPEASDPRERWLSAEEIAHLLRSVEQHRIDHCNDPARLSRLERFIWIGLETAARRAVIEKLTWDRVDLDRMTIDFRIPGKKLTKKRQGIVPISKRLLPILERAKKEARGRWVLDVPGEIWREFNLLMKQLGWDDVTPHTLRHTKATHMARAGVSFFKIAGVLGNTVAMVEKVYAKHSPDHLVGTTDDEYT